MIVYEYPVTTFNLIIISLSIRAFGRRSIHGRQEWGVPRVAQGQGAAFRRHGERRGTVYRLRDKSGDVARVVPPPEAPVFHGATAGTGDGSEVRRDLVIFSMIIYNSSIGITYERNSFFSVHTHSRGIQTLPQNI